MRNRYILLADAVLIALSAYGAWVLRFDWRFFRDWPQFFPFLIAALLLKPIVLYLFGMYARYWRYATAQDLVAIVLASSTGSLVMAVFVVVGQLSGRVLSFPRSVLVIDWLLTVIAIGGVRLSVRVAGDSVASARTRTADRRKRVLVAGAGQAGTMVLRESHRNPQLGFEIIGFLDDDPVKIGKTINGVPVLGRLAQLAHFAETRRVDEVVIAIPTAPGHVLRGIAEQCRQLGLRSRTMPGVFELLDGNVSVSRLRNIEIADLLRRAQVLPARNVASYVHGQTVLVTGAGGSIGFELCRQVARARPKVLCLLGHGENSIFDAQNALREEFPDVQTVSLIADVRDARRLRQLFGRFRPQVVFHAAAHKHVPLMEENPPEAITNNVVGTYNVVDAAAEIGVERFVMISTDKAVSPSSVMGASKRVAEIVVRAAARRTGQSYVVVRFGNVLGSRGSVVPRFKEQIERGGPVTLTHPDMKRFFMTIPEAVHLVLEAGGMGRGGELFVLRMGEPVRITDLAEDLIRLSGLSPDEVPIVYTGIRPGEKLEEALWERNAASEPTSHPDILRIRNDDDPDGPTCRNVAQMLDALSRAALDDDPLQIQARLAEYISTFAPMPTA